MIDFAKLKREWKTFALSVTTTVIGTYDTVVAIAQQYGYDYTQIIKAEYRLYVVPAIGLGFLALRKWRDANSPVPEIAPVPDVPEVTEPEVK